MALAEIATGYSALKSAYELAKGLKDINDRVALNAAVIDLQEKILSAQEAAAAAKDKLRELRETIEALENWGTMAARYQMKDFGGSTFAYELIAEKANGEPIHRACPRCFENRKRSILQFDYKDASQRDHYKCHACDSKFEFGNSVRYTPQVNRSSDWRA